MIVVVLRGLHKPHLKERDDDHGVGALKHVEAEDRGHTCWEGPDIGCQGSEECLISCLMFISSLSRNHIPSIQPLCPSLQSLIKILVSASSPVSSYWSTCSK